LKGLSFAYIKRMTSCDRDAPNTDCGRPAKNNCSDWKPGDTSGEYGYITGCQKRPPKCAAGYVLISECNDDCPGHNKGAICSDPTSDRRGICMRDWSTIMSAPNAIKTCCTNTEQFQTACDPDFCLKSSSCLSAMKTACTPTDWDASCDLYVNSAPTANARNLVQSVVSSYYSPTTETFDFNMNNMKSSRHGSEIRKRKQVSNENTMFGAASPIYSNHGSPDGTDPFVAKTVELCNLNPGVCDDTLKTVCSNYTRQQVEANPSLMSVCGCFLPPAEYPYRGMSDPLCDPVCIYPGTIRPGTSSGVVESCTATTCIMDGVTFNVNDSSVGGPISIQQACGGNGSPSQCYISNEVLNLASGQVGGGISIINNCQSCISYDSTDPVGSQQSIDCKTGKPISEGSDADHSDDDSDDGDSDDDSDDGDSDDDSTTSKITNFYQDHKTSVIIGIVSAVLLFIIILLLFVFL